MTFQGHPIADLDPEQLAAAEAWIVEQIEATQAHYVLLRLGYQEIADRRAIVDRQPLN